MPTSPVIVALDYDTAEAALALAEQLDPAFCRVKVGKELFTRAGPQLVERLQQQGFEVFLDLKFHDIPNTVAGAIRAAADLGVWMVNLHASGGSRMMRAARDALSAYDSPPLLIGVTVLTSMGPDDLLEIGYEGAPEQRVAQLAGLVQQSGLDGVVCSAQESVALRQQCGEDFLLVTPGIRLAGDSADDQRRVVTPAAAMAGGSSYLVIGRSITGADDPATALARVSEELAA